MLGAGDTAPLLDQLVLAQVLHDGWAENLLLDDRVVVVDVVEGVGLRVGTHHRVHLAIHQHQARLQAGDWCRGVLKARPEGRSRVDDLDLQPGRRGFFRISQGVGGGGD